MINALDNLDYPNVQPLHKEMHHCQQLRGLCQDWAVRVNAKVKGNTINVPREFNHPNWQSLLKT